MSKSSASTKYINMAHQWQIQGGAQGSRRPPFGRGRKEKEGEGEGEKVRKEGKEEKGERLWLAYSPLTVTAQIIMQQCLSHM